VRLANQNHSSGSGIRIANVADSALCLIQQQLAPGLAPLRSYYIAAETGDTDPLRNTFVADIYSRGLNFISSGATSHISDPTSDMMQRGLESGKGTARCDN